MRFRASWVTLALLTSSITACSDSATNPEEEQADPPEVSFAAATSFPGVPAELEISVLCWNGPDIPGAGVADDCPVLIWGGHRYWALSHNDNRGAMTVVAFDEAGALVKTWERPGARYLWQITVDVEAETVTFFGQSSGTIEMNWDELQL